MTKHRIALSILAVAGVLIPSAFLSGQGYVSDFEKRIAQVEQEISAIRAKLDDESRREASVLSTLARLDLNISLLQKELEADIIQVDKAGRELNDQQKTIDDLGERLDVEREQVERVLVAMHKFGKPDFAAFVLRAGDFNALAAETKRLSFLAKYEDARIAEFNRDLNDLQQARQVLEQNKRDLAERIRQTEAKRRELKEETKKNAEMVQAIRQNKTTYAGTLNELKESQAQLQVLMKKITSSEWVLNSPFVPFPDKRGRLPWPIAGRVISGFGLEVNPRFLTKTVNKGIAIAPAKPAAPVLAVHAGKIVFADYFNGYGNLLIIDHGLSYYSLYGHCSRFLVKAGDMVEAGQKIAVTGDTGSIQGECLYFEIRCKSQAEDPLKWLRRK